MIGTVKSFRNGNYKPYGFIATDYGTDYFFNLDGMKDRWRLPKTGDRVRFEIESTPCGSKATDIILLD